MGRQRARPDPGAVTRRELATGRRRIASGLLLLLAAAGWSVAAYYLWQTSVPDLHLPHVAAGDVLAPGTLRTARRVDRLLRIDTLLSQLVLLAAFAVYARYGARLTRESAAGRIGTGMLLAMLGFGVAWLAQLPFGLVALWWERSHHLSRVGYFTWIVGSWSTLGGTFLFICAAILIVMAVARFLPGSWWLVGAPLFAALALLQAFAQPYITPSLHPLADPALRADANTLAKADGLPPIPVFVQDVHLETTAPNAEAMGLASSRRIVLWDTFLGGRFDRRQLRVVLAHELGHLARDHILREVGWYALFAFPEAYLIAYATRRRGGMFEPTAVPLALLVFVGMQLAVQPVHSLISRHLEAEADWIAIETTRDPVGARSLFVRLAATSAVDPSPPTWDYVLYEGHPTIAQRIAMVEAWSARQRAGALRRSREAVSGRSRQARSARLPGAVVG